MSSNESASIQPPPAFLGIGHLLSNEVLQVPPYQRSYAWEEEHINALFDDLTHAYTEGQQYFLGSIIVTQAGTRKEVIDGQQRLATVAILIAAVRDFVHATNEPQAGELQRAFLVSRSPYDMETSSHLNLNREDKSFFDSYVLMHPGDPGRKTKPTKPSHRKIVFACEKAKERVDAFAGLHKSNPIKMLMGFVRFIADQACVICFTVPDHANAYVIFETLNDRGLELSQADLVKNHIFGAVGGDKIDVVQQNWSEMLATLDSAGGREMTATFIRQHWISVYGHLKDRRGVYKYINKEIQGPTEAINFSQRLLEDSQRYAALLSSTNAFWAGYSEDAQTYIDALKSLGVERLRPLLLAVLREYDPAEAKRVLRLSVSWSVRFLIAGSPAGTVEEKLNNAAKAVSSKELRDARSLLAHLGKIVPANAEFEAKFATATVSKPSLYNYYMRALENAYDESDSEPSKVVTSRTDVVNVEHIIPENPDDDWNLPQETVDAYLNRIGNLTLMRSRLNSKVGNRPFPFKRPYYQKEKFAMTLEVAEQADWGPSQIEERQKRLAKLAVRVWNLKIQ